VLLLLLLMVLLLQCGIIVAGVKLQFGKGLLQLATGNGRGVLGFGRGGAMYMSLHQH